MINVYDDRRVLRSHCGTSHDWITVATEADALALIEQYGLKVKYPPTEAADGTWRFAIRW